MLIFDCQLKTLKIFRRAVSIMPEFKTIRQVAATGLISEHFLRLMVARGECPGIRSGSRFLVNFTALAEMLDAESRKAVGAGE